MRPVMIAGLTVSIISCLGMALSAIFLPEVKLKKRIHFTLYCFFPLIGAIILLAFGLVDGRAVLEVLTSDSAVNPLQILVLFFSMVFISLLLDEEGFFAYLANLALRKAGEKQIGLFTILYLFVSVLTVFTSNDIIVLTFTPFLLGFCKNAHINPLPYLLGEFVAANTFSALLPVGNPTNIYLTSALGISFFDYLAYMALPALSSGLLAYLTLLLLFHKPLSQKMEKAEVEERRLADKPTVFFALFCLFFCIVCCALSSFFNLPSYLCCLAGALSLFLFALIRGAFVRRAAIPFKTIKRLPYSLLPLLLGMFVIVLALRQYGITKAIGDSLAGPGSIWGYGYSSLLAANLVNNIPMSVLYEEIFADVGAFALSDVLAVALSSNIAAYLTPLGALAGLMFLRLVHEGDVDLSFAKFSLYGCLVAILSLTAGLTIIGIQGLIF